ncbi:MAG: MobQ family relaxase, partial [Roseobacter sp.]
MKKGVSGVAVYHLSAKVISRAGGRSSVAAAAYRTAGRLRDDRQGVEHDYTRKSGVVHTEVMAPANAPDWMRDRDQLWNAIEVVEKRRDAQLAREIEVALPRELDRRERLELLRGFVQRELVDRGMIADVAVHEARARDGQGQPHAHVLLTMRELTGGGFGKKDRSWNAPDLLMGWREAWARDANTALERAGWSERIDHRCLDVQRAEAEQQVERALGGGHDELALEHEKKVV